MVDSPFKPFQREEFGGETEEFPSGQVVVEGRVLWKKTDAGSGFSRQRFTSVENPPPVGTEKTHENLEGRALAGAVVAEQSGDLSLRDREGDTVEDPLVLQPEKAPGVILCQVFDA